MPTRGTIGSLTQHEDGRLALAQAEGGVNPDAAAFQGDTAHQLERKSLGAEEHAVLARLDFMFRTSIVEGRLAADAKLHLAAGDADTADEPIGRVARLVGGDRHEILQLPHPFRRQEPRYEHVRVGPVKLLVLDVLVRRGDVEAAPLFIVEEGGKDAGRVEVGKTEPIDRTLDAHQRDGPHVADDAVIFDRLVAHG